MLQGFVRQYGGVNTSQNNRFSPAFKFATKVIGPGRSRCHTADANKIAFLFQVDRFSLFFNNANFMFFWG
jgi:hypothetical protein